MKIGILGTGPIGSTLVHDVAVTNSRGPDAIDPGLLVSGAGAVDLAGAVTDVKALICAIPSTGYRTSPRSWGRSHLTW